jgi:hypothetical protein
MSATARVNLHANSEKKNTETTEKKNPRATAGE